MIARSPLNIGMVSPHVAKLHCTPKRVVNGLARELPLERWWKRSDSNRHVSLCKSGALPIELQSHAGTGSFPKGSRLLEHVLVGGAGIEPAQMTRLQNGGLSLSLTSEAGETGRTRTFTSPLKRRLLCQLSYGSMETLTGFAPAPSSFAGSRSSLELQGQIRMAREITGVDVKILD